MQPGGPQTINEQKYIQLSQETDSSHDPGLKKFTVKTIKVFIAAFRESMSNENEYLLKTKKKSPSQ